MKLKSGAPIILLIQALAYLPLLFAFACGAPAKQATKQPAVVPPVVAAFVTKEPEYKGACQFQGGVICIHIFNPKDSPQDRSMDAYTYLTILGTKGCSVIGTDNSGTLCKPEEAAGSCETKWFQPEGSPSGTRVRINAYFRGGTTAGDHASLKKGCTDAPIWKNGTYKALRRS